MIRSCDTRCEDQAGVGLRQDVDAPALEQRGQRDLAEPDAVEERGDAQRLVGAQHVDVGEEVDGVPGHAAVGEHRALGAARRARGVEDQGGVLERDRRRLVEGRARRDLRRVVQRARVAVRVHREHGGLPGLGGQRGGVGAVHEDRGAGVVEHVADLRAREAVVQRDGDRAEQPGGEERLEHLDGVDAQVRHAVAAADAEPTQGARQPGGALGQLGVGERAMRVGERPSLRRDPGPAGGPGAQPRVRACHQSHPASLVICQEH